MRYNISNRVFSKLTDQQGATSVEFALIIFFVFIPLLFAIIEFGLLMYNQHIITNAGREGARLGIVFREDRISRNQIVDRVDSYAQNYTISFSNTAWDVNVQNLTNSTYKECVNSNDKLEISIDFKYSFLFLDTFVDLNSTTVMICE